MPNRIIKESVCESRGLSEISFFAEDLYKRLITYADDYGRFNADYQIILARLYPREIGIVTLDDIEDAMTELIGVGKIAFYTAQTRKEIYGCFPNWAEHQRVRESKKKVPAPEDTTINDWYLKRFIPKELKKQILERDKMKCQECGKNIFADAPSADRAIKFGTGLFHIDHIVPVCQGGRATYENLRLLCPRCNLSRKRMYSVEEIIELSHVAENGGELPQVSASFCLNPIQSNTKSNPNPNPKPTSAKADMTARFETFWKAYPKHINRKAAEKAFLKLTPDDGLLQSMLAAIDRQKQTAQWQEQGGQFIPYPATWLNGRRWEDELPAGKVATPIKAVVAQDYEQRDYEDPDETPEQMLKRLNSEMGLTAM